jgi:hypothetical protein
VTTVEQKRSQNIAAHPKALYSSLVCATKCHSGHMSKSLFRCTWPETSQSCFRGLQVRKPQRRLLSSGPRSALPRRTRAHHQVPLPSFTRIF